MFILKICKHASSAIPLCELNVGPVISIFTDLLKFQIKHCPISLKLGGHLASIENKDIAESFEACHISKMRHDKCLISK